MSNIVIYSYALSISQVSLKTVLEHLQQSTHSLTKNIVLHCSVLIEDWSFNIGTIICNLLKWRWLSGPLALGWLPAASAVCVAVALTPCPRLYFLRRNPSSDNEETGESNGTGRTRMCSWQQSPCNYLTAMATTHSETNCFSLQGDWPCACLSATTVVCCAPVPEIPCSLDASQTNMVSFFSRSAVPSPSPRACSTTGKELNASYHSTARPFSERKSCHGTTHELGAKEESLLVHRMMRGPGWVRLDFHKYTNRKPAMQLYAN